MLVFKSISSCVSADAFLCCQQQKDQLKAGPSVSCVLNCNIAALKIVVNIIGYKPSPEFTVAANRVGWTGYVKVLRQNKFNAAHHNITASVFRVRRNSQRF